MSRFVLTAQLQLQAPTNTAQVVRQIQSQLNNVQVNVQVQGTAQATRQVQQVAQSLNAANSAASNLGRTFAISVKRFTALAVATRAVSLFTNTLANATQEAIDFERQLVKVSQVTGQSIGELKGLTKTITTLSTGLGVGSKSLLEVSTILLQAGLNARDTEVALKSLAKAALAPNFDSITETAEGAIAILAQFQQGVGSLEGQLSSINAVAGAFAVEAGDLIDVIRRTGGVFKSSGGSLNELLALFTSVRATTRESAESIGTGLRTIFTRIQRPKTIEFLKQFGVELVDLEGKFVGPFEAVRRLSQALAGLGEGDITFIRIAEELGGFRQIGKVLPLIQQFSTAQAALNVAQKAGNGLTKDAQTAQAALAIRILKVREEFLALVRSITETSSFQFFANTTLNLASALIKLADALKPIIPLLAAVAGIKLAKGLSGFIGGFGRGVGSSRTFNDGGKVLKFARGGMVPGSGNRDTVPAMLQPGEFVIRKSSVNKLGAGNLAAMNENRYAAGGLIDRISIGKRQVGAAILENRSVVPGSFSITKKDIEQRSGLKLNDKFPKLGSFSAPREGLSQTTYKSFSEALDNAIVSATNQAAASVANDLGLQSKQIDQTTKQSFLSSINTGTRGNLFEDTLSVLKGGPFSQEPGRPFDFPQGLSNVLKDDYKNLPDAFIDAKASLDAASLSGKGSLLEKTIRQITNELKLPENLKLYTDNIPEKGKEKFDRTKQYTLSQLGLKKSEAEKAGFKKVGSIFYQLRSLGGIIQKFAKGGMAQPLVDDILSNAPNAVLPKPQSAIQKLINSGGGFVDIDRTLKRTIGDQAYARARTEKERQAVLSKYFANSQNRLNDIKTAGLTQFGTELQNSIKSGQLSGSSIRVISKSPNTPGVAEYLSGIFGIPSRNFAFTGGRSKVPLMRKFASGGGVGTDTVPALLTPGEFVINKKSAQSIGYGSLNRMNKVGKYANGGIVGIQKFAKGGQPDQMLAQAMPIINANTTKFAAATLKLEKALGILTFGLTDLYANSQALKLKTETNTAIMSSFGTAGQKLVSALEANNQANQRSIKNQDNMSRAVELRVLDLIRAGATDKELEEKINKYIQALDKDTKAKQQSAASTAKSSSTPSIPSSGGGKGIQPTKSITPSVGGASKTSQGNNNIFTGLGSQLTLVTASLQALLPPVDENSSTFATLTNSMLSFATTIGGAIFALEAFGLTINKELIGKAFKSLSSGEGGLGDIIGGFQRQGGKTVRTKGESFTDSFSITKRQSTQQFADARNARAKDLLAARAARKSSPFQLGSNRDWLDSLKEETTDLNLRRARPQSLTGKLGNILGKKAAGGGIGGKAAGLAGRAISGVGGLGNLGGGAVGRIAGSLTSLAGPLTAIVGSATLVSGAFNTLITSMYDYDKQLQKATEKGDVQKAGEIAGKQYDLEAANSLRTAGAVTGGAIGAAFLGPLGATIGSAIGGLIGTISGTIVAALPFGDKIAEFFNVAFGGNTKASVVALAEANAQAAKTAKELEKAQKTTADAIKEFEDGTINAATALDRVMSATATTDALTQKTDKAISENLKNKSTGALSYGREAAAYLTFGYVDSTKERNSKIDAQNAKMVKDREQALLKGNELRAQAGLATARPEILTAISQGKTPEQIRESLPQMDVLKKMREQQKTLDTQAVAAKKGGNIELSDALTEQANAVKEQADNYSTSIDNLIKEQTRLEKALKTLDLGLRGPASTASAAAAELEYFASQIEGTALPAVSALNLLEASFTSAGATMNKDQLKQATDSVVSTLQDVGATASSIDRFRSTTEALNNVQSKYGSVAAQIAEEQKKSGKKFSDTEILDKFAEKLGEGMPDEIKSLIGGIKLTDEIKDQIARGDYSGIGDAIGEQGKKLLEPINNIVKDYQKANQVLIDLTKKRIDAERSYVSAVKEAEDLAMEGREIQAKYGGAAVTMEDRRQSILNKANAGNGLTGLSQLQTGGIGELRARNREIAGRYSANQAQLRSGAVSGKAAGEVARQQQDDLKNAQKEQVQTIRDLIKLEEENLKLIGEKNKLEKDSVDALVSGDIDKFFEQQAAAGAQAAIALGSDRLQGAFGANALGAAAQDIRRQQEAGQQTLFGQQLAGPGGLTERAFGAAIGARGITDSRLAQVAAGTTAEEELAKSRLRDLGGALGEAGELGADLAQMDVKEATMNVAQAEIKLQEVINRGKEASAQAEAQIGAAVGRRLGGLIYANRGVFVPRGTDTVPAMLTPGEFVVRREAVQRGNNLQLLQAMNRGSSAGQSSVGGSIGMARGGIVRYRADGSTGPEVGGLGINPEIISRLAQSLDKFNTDLSANIEKLNSTNFSIKLDTTNVNVNLNGGSFLNKMKDELREELMKEVANKIQNYKAGEGGSLKENRTVLG